MKYTLVLLLASLIWAVVGNAFGEVVVSQKDAHVSIQNQHMRLDFDLNASTYSGTSIKDNILLFSHAGFLLDPGNGQSQWRQPTTICKWEQMKVQDAFGKGVTLKIIYEPQAGYDPARILLLTLYENQPFISIGWGVRNRFDYSIRVARAEVLSRGVLFEGQTINQPMVLRGGSGSEQNFVESGWEIEALNSAMLTYKDGPTRRTVVAGGLAYKEFIRKVEIIDGFYVGNSYGSYNRASKGMRQMTLICEDPQGKYVPAGMEWISGDTFYLDYVTADPFVNLEQYGDAMALANNAKPNFYDFPTLCGWAVSSKHLGEGRDLNHSAGMVEQLDIGIKKGFLKYASLAVRIEPDYYCYYKYGDTQQGWWDDEHFVLFGSLQKPYETFEKYCAAVSSRGGIPFTYFQCSMPSNDFAVEHPDWMLNNDISRLHIDHYHHYPTVTFDYTDPGFREYMLNVWRRLANEGLKGVKFDYPETAWAQEGGFEDKRFTTTSAYRAVFELCREGLGESAYIHERNLGAPYCSSFPRHDATAGIVDLQRIWTDASHYESEMCSRMGLRWYKNRNVFTYYPDSKSMLNNKTKEPLPTHLRRTILNVHAFLAGRLELASSFNHMNEEIIHDLTRIYPVVKERHSPRPADMLMGKKHPEVYVYPITKQWRQVLLLNNDTTKEMTIAAPLSGDMVDTGSLGLDMNKRYHIYDFWDQRYLGIRSGTDTLSIKLKPMASLVCSVREVMAHPQVLSTNRHIMQGLMEMHNVEWDESTKTLSGKADVIGEEDFQIIIAANGYKATHGAAKDAQAMVDNLAENLVAFTLKTQENKQVEWALEFLSAASNN